MDLKQKDEFIEKHLMPLTPETLRYMVADLSALSTKYLDALERIGNILATVLVLELDPEDESDLANSQGALFEIAIIREQAMLV